MSKNKKVKRKPNNSATFNLGLVAVDEKGRVKKSQKQKKKIKTQADEFSCPIGFFRVNTRYYGD